MKKISLFFGCLFLFISCASTQWAINGDVTAYNADGTVLRQWDNVVIESGYVDWNGKQTTTNAMKTFGINFSDPKTHKYVIISNAVPCIIEYTDKAYENASLENTRLVDLFKNGDISSLDDYSRKAMENNFISEIKTDISTAKTKQDILVAKDKIETLNAYHQKMAKKGSYFDILDALQLMNIQLSKKARNLGVKL